jgi:hypothetical protein
MRELGHAGQADPAEALARRHHVAGLHREAALGHVAVLGFPALAVLDHEPVAAFHGLDALAPAPGDGDILHPVADPQDLAARGREHVDARLLGRQGRHPDVGAGMTRIGEGAALVVLGGRRRVAVDIVLNDAGRADLAGHRQAQGHGLRGGRTGAQEGDKGGNSRTHDRSDTLARHQR